MELKNEEKLFNDILNYMVSKNILDDFTCKVWFNNIRIEKNDNELLVLFPSIITKDKFEKNILMNLIKF